MKFYAHTSKLPDGTTNPDTSTWEPLFTSFGEDDLEKCERMETNHGHLNKVAYWTAKFAAEMFPANSEESKSARQWGYLTGLWHDLGKFSVKFQNRLNGDPQPVNHSSAGARHCADIRHFGSLISYLIAGHHAGLADGNELFEQRMKKEIPQWLPNAEASGIPLTLPLPYPPITRSNFGNDDMAFMLRFFFSCLVDADFLTTEAFMNQEQAKLRPTWPDDMISQLLPALESHLASKFANTAANTVNQARENVRQACFAAASHPSGFFSLTVPTSMRRIVN